MKQVVYGNMIYPRHALKDLMFLLFINVLIATITYLLIATLLSLPLYTYVLYLLVYLSILFMIKQHTVEKQYIIFDEEGIHRYTYSKNMYLDLWKHKPPMEVTIAYAQLRKCRITYRKANKRSTSQYLLSLHLERMNDTYEIEINPSFLSSNNMNWILSLLSNKVAVLIDPYQLRLCLMQQHLGLDAYIKRLEVTNENDK